MKYDIKHSMMLSIIGFVLAPGRAAAKVICCGDSPEV